MFFLFVCAPELKALYIYWIKHLGYLNLNINYMAILVNERSARNEITLHQ